MTTHHVRRRTLWATLRRGTLLIVGTLIVAVGYAVFQVPHDIAAGGVSGIAILVNHFAGISLAAFYFVVNIPLLVLGSVFLGGWRFLVKTVISVVVFSAATEAIVRYLPLYLGPAPISQDVLLSAVYAGLISGIGAGLVYAAGATTGGTDIVGRIIQLRTGIPLSQVYLWVDGAIVILAGIVFGWEIALYAILTVLLTGLAADYALEGPSRTRTAIVITNRPQEVTHELMAQLERGVTRWDAVGGYTGDRRAVIMCTIYRPQVNDLRRIVADVDPTAFVTIGVTQQVMGSGFTRL
jgi:uncharacterized membrane-anchored protein YitT (DUF2179 family)